MDNEIRNKIKSYPPLAYDAFMQVRDLIYKVAQQENFGVLNESLKWGEPSYSAKNGSPLRVDWKPKHPNQISLYVNCQTKLVETFKELYSGCLEFRGNREIVLPLGEPLPNRELEVCISIVLQYHSVKHLPHLGL